MMGSIIAMAMRSTCMRTVECTWVGMANKDKEKFELHGHNIDAKDDDLLVVEELFLQPVPEDFLYKVLVMMRVGDEDIVEEAPVLRVVAQDNGQGEETQLESLPLPADQEEEQEDQRQGDQAGQNKC